MRIFNHFYQIVFFRALDMLRSRKTTKRLKFLRNSQFWDEKQLNAWQLEKLNLLLFNAKKFSPYYQNKFAKIKLPLKDLDQIQELPVVTKKDMRDRFEEIRCTNIPIDKCELSKTGGSTGEPSYYYLHNECKDWNRASVYRSAEWAGVYLGDKTVQMMGSHYDFKEFQKLKWKLVFLLQRYRDLSVANINENLLEKYFEKVVKFKPTSIWGYASGIHLFASHIRKYHPDANFDFIKGIITSSENLQDSWRSSINEVFGDNKVFDHYGSREMYIASECKMHNGYHIHAENIILEIVGPDNKKLPKGTIGRILVTDLTNKAFPFIRYEIGDVGVLSVNKKCQCGIRLPLLEKIEGRIADMVVLKDRILTPPNFTLLMSDFEGIGAYQIVQDKMDTLSVNLVINDKFNETVKKYISNALHDLVGPDVKIAINHVEDIHVPLSGKRRFIISNIASELI